MDESCTTPSVRTALLPVALAVLTVLAGCAAGGPGGGGPGAAGPGGGAGGDCSPPGTRTVTTTAPTPTPSGTGQLPGGVSIRTRYDGTVSVVLVRAPGGANVTTFARRYEGESPGDLGPEMLDWADYRVVIRVECEVVWNRTVHDYEAYELRITGDGDVEVVSVAEA